MPKNLSPVVKPATALSPVVKPAAQESAFGQNVMPTNGSLVGRLGTMLNAMKNIGRPATGGKPPFAR